MKKISILSVDVEKKIKSIENFVYSINWDKVIFVLCLYAGGFYGFYHIITLKPRLFTYFWAYNVFMIGGIGLGPGAHRYFSHRSYKATRGFKIILIICQTIAGQYTVLLWSQVHRVHHKYADTDKDPTNINRGFWFAHIYWIFRYSPECKKAMDSVELSDLKSDKDVMFQYKYYYYLNFIFCIFLPTIIPYLLWNEVLWTSFWVNMFRWLLNYNQMSFANSVMHTYGKKPYDKNISATEHLFTILYTYGEGYHNYHHVFPWDYKAAEFGDLLHFNFSTFFIDFYAKYGFVYDRKVVTQSMVDRRKARTGDGTHWLTSKDILKNPVWGYGDIDMDVDDKMDIHAYVYDQNNNLNDKEKES